MSTRSILDNSSAEGICDCTVAFHDWRLARLGVTGLCKISSVIVNLDERSAMHEKCHHALTREAMHRSSDIYTITASSNAAVRSSTHLVNLVDPGNLGDSTES